MEMINMQRAHVRTHTQPMTGSSPGNFSISKCEDDDCEALAL